MEHKDEIFTKVAKQLKPSSDPDYRREILMSAMLEVLIDIRDTILVVGFGAEEEEETGA